jgi:hypothetical protein
MLHGSLARDALRTWVKLSDISCARKAPLAAHKLHAVQPFEIISELYSNYTCST